MKLLSLGLLVLYFVVMFPLLPRVERLGEYASYYFESGFILQTGWMFWRRLSFKIPGWRWSVLDLAIGMIAGLLIYRFAAPLGLPIPFDLSSRETLVLLLLVGPLIEEFIFRMALWELLAEFVRKPLALLLLTSAIFSFAHFFAWFSVPEAFRGFVLYQTIYTLALGIYCGFRKQKSGSMAAPVMVHMAFNLGFWLGSMG